MSPERKLARSVARKIAFAGAAFVAAFLAGCGAGYRPVVTPTNPAGPQAQPAALVTVVSSPSPTSAGVVNVVDYAGDTVLAQATVGPGPIAFTLDQTGLNGFTFNSDGTISDFPANSSLQEKQVVVTTLPAGAEPFGFMAPAAQLWATDLASNDVDVFTGTQPAIFKIAIPVDPTPIMVIGPTSAAQYNYAITQGAVGPTTCNTAPSSGPAGFADSILAASDSVSNKLQVGRCPVYAVQTPDSQRIYVLNRGDDTISVINTQTNTLDNQCPTGCFNKAGQKYYSHPLLPLSTAGLAVSCPTVPPTPNTNICSEPINLSTANLPATAGPVYAEYNLATQQLVVADFAGGTISIIDVSLDTYGNDSPTFGTTYTVAVGTGTTPNPASVTVLYDGSRAYTANQNDDSTGNGSGNGTVTIVNLSSHTVEKTLQVNGHPRTVASTQNSLEGKVYVASPDSTYLTIIRTDEDIVDTTVLVQGNVVDLRVSSQNGSAGNANVTSRQPGYGAPCNLSAQQYATAGVPPSTLLLCQAQSAAALSAPQQ
ncbi:YncE family protein [Terracidiphilus sp.]|jgi:YVTN family beta-propeller protein|uniref:YncE family protein n=1 Tax=Terracidiphilus sp. TaxID=1964191 RepID=UPI003C22242E